MYIVVVLIFLKGRRVMCGVVVVGDDAVYTYVYYHTPAPVDS